MPYIEDLSLEHGELPDSLTNDLEKADAAEIETEEVEEETIEHADNSFQKLWLMYELHRSWLLIFRR